MSALKKKTSTFRFEAKKKPEANSTKRRCQISLLSVSAYAGNLKYFFFPFQRPTCVSDFGASSAAVLLFHLAVWGIFLCFSSGASATTHKVLTASALSPNFFIFIRLKFSSLKTKEAKLKHSNKFKLNKNLTKFPKRIRDKDK